jgi:hypothetical protein
LHKAGRDDLIPFEAMMLTTVVAEAERMVALENGPEFYVIPQLALRIGKIGFMGVSGEPFTGVGRRIKEAKGYDIVLPCCCTNGDNGYFPMKDAYEEGGYEARSSHFKTGVAEILAESAVEMLEKIIKK